MTTSSPILIWLLTHNDNWLMLDNRFLWVRIAALDLAQYLTESAQRGRKVSNDAHELQREGRKAAGAAAAQQKQMWADTKMRII